MEKTGIPVAVFIKVNTYIAPTAGHEKLFSGALIIVKSVPSVSKKMGKDIPAISPSRTIDTLPSSIEQPIDFIGETSRRRSLFHEGRVNGIEKLKSVTPTRDEALSPMTGTF